MRDIGENMKKILIADDDINIRNILKRKFSSNNCLVIESSNGLDAIKEIKDKNPDLVILDVNMPGVNGKEVLMNLRNDIRTLMTPVIVITGYGEVLDKIDGLQMGADDYIQKPFNINELLIKANNLMERHIMALSSSPLTQMPGSTVIEKIANEKIKSNEKFAFLYIDIDNFKVYNDTYGYLKGDVVIKKLASIIKSLYDKFKDEFYLAGHIGGDDFIVLCDYKIAEKVADNIAFSFDWALNEFYSEIDYKNGFIEGVDRKGEKREFSLMSLSIAIVSNETKLISHYGKFIDIAFEIKRYLKSFKNRKGSLFLKDRRKD
jgi:diguanylate cyclase (GGDEF)-like protein